MSSVTRIFNLENVSQAREFLSKLRFNGRQVTNVTVETGEVVEFKNCTDDQAIAFAKQLYEMQSEKKWRRSDRRDKKIKKEFAQ